MNELLKFVVEKVKFKNMLFGLNQISGQYDTNNIVSIQVNEEDIVISRPGIHQRMKAKTEGRGVVTLPEKIFEAYLKTYPGKVISFSFKQGEMECGSSVFNSTAIEVSPVPKRKKSEPPINIDRESVLRYCIGMSELEIKRQGIYDLYEKAMRKMRSDLLKAEEILNLYGVKYDDLKQLLIDKIKRT